MSKQPNGDTEDQLPSTKNAAILLLGDIADTTWRMFLPTIAGIVGGAAADSYLGTSPWLFAIGTLVGCVIAGMLVKKQLEKTK